jgi:nitroimidazol reductase NimA-like FMN-containing flavoprotein (pyridoxamine 5'-phosphate oxidase superfamily)
VFETPDELERLDRLLGESMAAAGPHLRAVVTPDRRLSAAQLCSRLEGMRLLVVATTSADGKPLTAPVDGYFLHGAFEFSSGRQSVKMRHLARRPEVSATHLPGDALCVTVHGRAELFDVLDPARPALRQAMLDHYLARQGPAFAEWLEREDPIGARIDADRMVTFALPI